MKLFPKLLTILDPSSSFFLCLFLVAQQGPVCRLT
jgi:hypothetical protein